MLRSASVRAGSPARAPQRKPVFVVDEPGDRFEREADRAADAVVKGAGAKFALSAVPVQHVQRQGAATPAATTGEKTEEEKYTEAGRKVAEAFVKTPQGKQVIEAIEADPLVSTVKEGGEKFLGTTPGKVVAGATVVGAVAALAATHRELPIGVPDIPLAKVSPKLAGWKMQITWEGPVDRPTRAMVGFSFSAGGDKKRAPRKQGSELDRLQAEDARFRAGMSYAPGSKEAKEQAMLDAAVREVAARHSPPSMLGGQKGQSPATGGAAAPQFGPGFLPSAAPADRSQLRQPEDSGKVEPATQDEGKGEAQKEKEEPLMRKADGSRAPAPTHAPAAVESTLAAPGQPLDRATRALMESRFGFDFGHVRIHADAAAGESARAIDAVAYSVGRDVVFAAGAYSPTTAAGQWLLAHELAHIVQQGEATAGEQTAVAPPVRRLQRKAGTAATPDPVGTALRGGDDDARALTKSAGWTTLRLTPQQAATLLIHLLKGATWDDDEQAGLRILRKMIAEDLLDPTLEQLGEQRRFGQLLDDYDGSEYGQLLDLLSKNIKTTEVGVGLLDKFISMSWLSTREQKAVVVLIEHARPASRIFLLQGGRDRVEALRRHIDDRGIAVTFEKLLAHVEYSRWAALFGQLTSRLSGVFTIKSNASVARGQRTRAEADLLLEDAASDLAAELLEYRDRINGARDKPDELAAINKEYMRRLDSLGADKSREFDLELKYNVEFDRLLYDLKGKRVTYGRPWTATDLEAIDRILAKIPPDIIHASPDLKILARATLDPKEKSTAGVSERVGKRIQLRMDLPVDDADARWWAYESTAHELGHFVQDSDENDPQHPSTGLVRAFLDLSEWSYLDRQDLARLIPDRRDRDKLEKALDADYAKHQKDADFKGEDHRLDMFVYRFSRYQTAGNYVRRRHGASFIRQYASTDPKDDFADTFGYFFAAADYLQEKCPKKYEFMLVRVMTDYRLNRQKGRVLDEFDRIIDPLTTSGEGISQRILDTHLRPLRQTIEVQLNGLRAIRTAQATQSMKAEPKPVTMEPEAERFAAPFLVRARGLVAAAAPILDRYQRFRNKRELVELRVTTQTSLVRTFREVADRLDRDLQDALMGLFAPLAQRLALGEDVRPPTSWPELDARSGKFEVGLSMAESYLPAYSDTSVQPFVLRSIVQRLVQTVTDKRRRELVGPKVGPLLPEFDAEMERWRDNARARMLAGQPYRRQAVERPVEARERYQRRAEALVRETR